MIYRSVWKCRLCGERFYGNINYTEETAKRTIVNLPEQPLSTNIHECFGGIGVADFQGMERINDEV